MKKIALIGSTGSIGTQVLNVVRRNPEKFSVVSMSAHKNARNFLNQITEFKPAVCALDYAPDGFIVPYKSEFFTGKDAYLNAVISDADIVVVAVVGYTGLKAVLKAIELKKDVALANKESLVVGGELVTSLAKKAGVNIYPIDSEHSAIWQALNFNYNKPFKRLILTASGGAFRDFSVGEIESATAKQALKHPNWNMGNKITIDCATLVNKAFEIIEARWLYDVDYSKIDAIIHRESIIHSMVEFDDNSVMAQMSYPTMEIPIALALDKSLRLPSNVPSLDFAKLSSLHFEEIDKNKFPCFDAVVTAGKKGGLYPAVVNAVNEVAVDAFLKGKIVYKDFYSLIDGALNAYTNRVDYSLSAIEDADAWARNFAQSKID